MLIFSRATETTRWNLRNYNCKQILLGISHDAGYAPFLDEILQDADTRRRVTLLEGVPTVKEIVSTNMNILNLHNDLFRSSKLVDRAAAANAASQVARPEGSAGSVQTSPPAAFSYAGATKVGSPPPPQLTLPLGPRSANAASRQKRPAASASTTTTAATWNPGPRGLDEPIPAFSAQAMEAVKKRKENKLCNNYYLRKTCVKGDECSFVHDARPSQDEVNAVALLARLNPCMQGQDCDVKDCIYGHNVGRTPPSFCVFAPLQTNPLLTDLPATSVPASRTVSASTHFVDTPRSCTLPGPSGQTPRPTRAEASPWTGQDEPTRLRGKTHTYYFYLHPWGCRGRLPDLGMSTDNSPGSSVHSERNHSFTAPQQRHHHDFCFVFYF